jgi:hypothetical protein
MIKVQDKRYLVKQRNVWYFRIKIPVEYRHAFNGVKLYKRSTGEMHLDKAIEVRDIMELKLKYMFKQIDTGKKASIPEMAQKHLEELKEYRQAQLDPNISEDESEGAKELEMLKQDEIIEEADRLFSLDSNLVNTGAPLQSIKKIDKTGNAIKFIQEATGQTFNALDKL